MLVIALMFASAPDVQAQNRRTGSSNNGSKSDRSENIQARPSSGANRTTQSARQQSQVKSSQQRQPANVGRVQHQNAASPSRPGSQSNLARPAGRPASHPVNRNMGFSKGAPRPVYHPAPHRYSYRPGGLPVGARPYVHAGIRYYHLNGIFYRPYKTGYIICRPPVGYRFERALLHATLTAVIFDRVADAINESRRQDYYYNDGVYYTRSDNDYYTVVEAPVGALVKQIPDDYTIVEIEGIEYYKVDDTLYKTTVYDGIPYFEVVAHM